MPIRNIGANNLTLTSICLSFIALASTQFFGFTLVTAIGFGMTFGMSWVLTHRFVMLRFLYTHICQDLAPSTSALMFSIFASLMFGIMVREYQSQIFQNNLLQLASIVVGILLGQYFGYRVGCTIGIIIDSGGILRIFYTLLLISCLTTIFVFVNSAQAFVFLLSIFTTAILFQLWSYGNEEPVNGWLIFTSTAVFIVQILTLISVLNHFSFFKFI